MANISKSRRRKLLLFGNNKFLPCCYCNMSLSLDNSSLEHIIPLAAGGGDNIKNITISCMPCNSKRGSMPLDKWLPIAKFTRYEFILRSLGRLGRIMSFGGSNNDGTPAELHMYPFGSRSTAPKTRKIGRRQYN